MEVSYHLVIKDKELWKAFKIKCVVEDITIRDKITELIKDDTGYSKCHTKA
jgi:hypothetical protein